MCCFGLYLKCSPKDRVLNKGLVAIMWHYQKAVKLLGGRPNVRKLGYWGCALEGDIEV
jgi:hypothetical protein